MQTITSPYNARLQAVLDYIHSNLDGNLALGRLCQIAFFSPFHFHRQFRHSAGVPLNEYIRLLRMKKACHQLVYSQSMNISDISAAAGFENSESFSRAFKKMFELTPSAFRKTPDWEKASIILAPTAIHLEQENLSMNVRILTLPSINLAVLEHHGSHHRLHHSVGQFIAWRKNSGQSPVKTSMTIGVPWKDPNTVAAEEFHFDICGSLQEGEVVEPNDFGVINKSIPGGRFAVLRHPGSTDIIDTTCYKLYRDWLPESGEELRDFPCFFHYIERMPAVTEHEQVTDVYLPLK